jgi:antitoxin component of RelBE/YafQ-DinJ toxin-antitoxin module
MARLASINVRLSTEHLRMLKRISEKTGLNRTNAIRLAITRLADEEKVRSKLLK